MLNRGILLVIFLLLVLGCIYARRRRLAGMRILTAVTGLVIVFDVSTVNWQNNFQETNPQDDYGPCLLLALMQADQGTSRAYNEFRLPGNYGMIYEVEDIAGASPLRLKWYEELVTALPVEHLWELLSVKYVITWRRVLLAATELLYEEPTGADRTYLQRLEDYLPRAYVVHQAQATKGEEALKQLADPEFDPLETMMLEEPDLELLEDKPTGESMVRILEYEPTRVVLEARAATDSILVLNEVYYPCWRAYVNGGETRIYRADHAIRALVLEAGYHR